MSEIGEKYKRAKKAVKNISKSSSESDGGYDSRKENKVSKKHKRKYSSREKERSTKYSTKIDTRRYVDRSPEQDYKLIKKQRRDASPEIYCAQNKRKRNREQKSRSSSRELNQRSQSREQETRNKNSEHKQKNKELKHKSRSTEPRQRSSNREPRYRSSSRERRWRSSSGESRPRSSTELRQSSSSREPKQGSSREPRQRISRELRQRSSSTEPKQRITREPRQRSRSRDPGQRSREPRQRSRSRERKSRSRSVERQRYGKWTEDSEGRKELKESSEISLPSVTEDKTNGDFKKTDDVEPLSRRMKIGNINMRTGGAYIPPAKLRMMQEKIQDKNSEEYQRIAWEALKKSIVGMTNKVNSSNIADIVRELFKENIIRGRGVLARAIMQAQAASPTFTKVYAALVAVINTKFPEVGELIMKRITLQYKRAFRRNDKAVCMAAARFLAHLLNQEVAHEILILEIVTHLLENPTEDSVEIAIAVLKECGRKLNQLTARGMRAITQRVREVLHEGNVDVRVRYMIEVFFAVQKDGFKDFETIPEELDLVPEEDKYTHMLTLDEVTAAEEMLNVFKFDADYLENEEKYKSIVREILGDSDDEEESDAESNSEEEEEEEKKDDESQQIIDMTETNIVCLRRKIYLTIQSSLDFEECAHKLLKLELKPGQILEMCYMILDCCAQQRTYEKFYGLLAQRFCQLNKVYVEPFTEIFENSYKTIHRLETNKLRNVAKFFAHLLYTDAISWTVLSIIKLNEEDTTSSSRIFIKILFQELSEYMGLLKLNERVKDVTLQEAFDGLFPRDHPHNTRFAVNFFTSIGLGGLTDELREHLKNLPKNPVIPVAPQNKESSSSESPSSSSTSSSSSSDSE